MYTGRFFLFFFFYASEMGDVKALISHQMFEAKEICGLLEKEKRKILGILTA